MDVAKAYEVLYHMCWTGMETAIQELSGLQHLGDHNGVSMYYQ